FKGGWQVLGIGQMGSFERKADFAATPYYSRSIDVVARATLHVEKTEPLYWLAIAAEFSLQLVGAASEAI
ncbi:hypothetical protein, partial [Serratia marcescens]|uniref:hypothetical protein n=1 Tax=Serratia marcescens TaxID=615 RepID=UPI003318C04F